MGGRASRTSRRTSAASSMVSTCGMFCTSMSMIVLAAGSRGMARDATAPLTRRQVVVRLAPRRQSAGGVRGEPLRGDLEWVSIPRLVLRAADAFGHLEALVDGDVRLTFPELAEAMRASTRAAIAAGIQPGDRASIWAPNCQEWVVAALGVLGAGGVLVPLNTRFKGQEAGYVLGKSRARMLFTVTGFLETDYVELLRGAD